MPELKFQVSGQPAIFPKAHISQTVISTNGHLYYGNVGQDLINQFGKMTISFINSYIAFEPKKR